MGALKASILIITFSFLLILCGCSSSQLEDPPPSNITTTDTQTAAPDVTTMVTNVDTLYEIPWVDPDAERSTWNIDIELESFGKTGFFISITDHDNLGFVYNPVYFILEKYENGEWRKVSTLNEIAEDNDRSYVVPKQAPLTAGTSCLCRYMFLENDLPPTPGHYRITKVLSGTPITAEFDITEADLAEIPNE